MVRMFHLTQNESARVRLRLISVFILGIVFLYVLQKTWSVVAPCHWKYALINPALRCEETASQGEWDYEDMRNELLEKKTELSNAGKITELSVYFRDLDHGPRFGIGEFDAFQPASLLKFPVLIAFLHEADRDPGILSKTLSYSGSLQVNMNVEETDQTIQPNTPYAIRELLKKMIIYSDNYSYALLTKELNKAPPITAYHTFRDLGVLRMMVAPKADFVSIQSYSNLFAVLYNTGYLSRDMSQYALEILSEASFKDGLVAGVPAGTRIAHKFGHRVLGPENSQLHDCGIIYHPATNYVLCVMTSGKTIEEEGQAISEVSKVVYDFMTKLKENGDEPQDSDMPSE